MIGIIETNSPKSVGVKIAGKIEHADMNRTIQAIRQKLEQTEKLGIYVVLESFTGISSEALVEDLKYEHGS